jgi:hypothetical protein
VCPPSSDAAAGGIQHITGLFSTVLHLVNVEMLAGEDDGAGDLLGAAREGVAGPDPRRQRPGGGDVEPEAGEQRAVGLDTVLQAVQLPADVALLQYLIQYIQYI